MKTDAYVQKYADFPAAETFLQTYIRRAAYPPVQFWADGTDSDTLAWEKTEQEVQTVIDYPDEAPTARTVQTIRYRCPAHKLCLTLTLTQYPGYPVVEYEGNLSNEGAGRSPVLRELCSVHHAPDAQNDVPILHAMRGSIFGPTGIAGTDFTPLTYTSFADGGVELAVTTGRPSETYLPYFNLENPVCNTGTVAILNWQGSWKARFTESEAGLVWTAGQYRTDFVLEPGESVRLPGVVLLFYRGGKQNGQNVYRRWAYNCNLFRDQGRHMKRTNILNCSNLTSEIGDRAQIDLYRSCGLLSLFDKYNVDAGDGEHGWYPTDGKDWSYVGTWTPSPQAYPNGLKPTSDLAHEEGLQFALWLEPERLHGDTQTAQDLPDCIIGLNEAGEACFGSEIPPKSTCLINYGKPEAVDYVVRLLTDTFRAFGVDQYRQDFNMHPAPYWAALDVREAKERGIPRTGLSENFACTGYLTVWKKLLEANPGMYFDACASGGTRYDLSTMRCAFMHTRSDEWFHTEHAQNQSYGSANWFLYCGTGLSERTLYGARSHISNSLGAGMPDASQAEAFRTAIEEWKALSDYLFFDYYPLTPYAGFSDRTMAMQYDSPEEGRGMFVTYFRREEDATVCPQALDPTARYRLWNRDDCAGSETVLLGAEIMQGVLMHGTARSATVWEYCLAEGENTAPFQSASVQSGRGSTNFDPASLPGRVRTRVEIPAVRASFSPDGWSDAALKAAYTVSGDDRLVFIGYDFMCAGSIYAISKNLYDCISKTGKTVRTWTQVDKKTCAIEAAGTFYPLEHWDWMPFIQQPYVKEIEGTCFLWMTNTVGMSDPDGGWSNTERRMRFIDSEGTAHLSEPFIFRCEGAEAERIHATNEACVCANDAICRIDEEIFGSLPYTGYAIEMNGTAWYELDGTACGFLTPTHSKAPDETLPLEEQVQTCRACGVRLYTRREIQTVDGAFKPLYELYISGASGCGGRRSLLWRAPDGRWCAQSFRLQA